jgi:spore coat protein CotH
MIMRRVGRSITAACTIVLGLLVFQLVPSAQAPGQSPGGPGPGFPDLAAMFGERPVLDQFDADKNGWLNLEERMAARAWLAAQPPTGLAALAGRFGPPGGGGLAALMGGRGFAPASAGRRTTPADVPSGGEAPLYDVGTLRTIFLQFEAEDWEQELAAFNNTDVDVPATVIVDGRTYADVGVHFRGMSSFMMVPEGSKRSLNLAFDFVQDDQRLLGYRTLNLLNGINDATFVRQLLYAHIAQQYIPAPRSNYVRVVVNGEYWGVYMSAQQFNSDFVRDWFDTTDGARWRVPGSPMGQGGMVYLGENPELYKGIYSIRTKDREQSWSDLIQLFRVLNETPADALEAAIAPLLDVDGVLKFLALELALVNSDGYWTRASDYSIYQDGDGRFHVIPHDMNEGLKEEGGGGGRGRGRGGFPPPGFQLPPGIQFPPDFGRAGVDLDPLVGLDDNTKALRAKLLAVPALRARYMGYVRDIAERWLDWTTLEPLVRQYHGLVADAVMTDTRKLYSSEAFTAELTEGEESLKSFVDRRRAFLLGAQ